MILETVSPAYAAIVARELFLLLHPSEQAWFDLAWDACSQAPLPSDWSVKLATLPGLGVLPRNAPVTEQLARDFAVMAATFLIQSPVARNELIERLKEASTKRGHAKPVREWIAQAANEILNGKPGSVKTSGATPSPSPMEPAPDYLVWNLSAHDVISSGPKGCASAEIDSRYWNLRGQYDLFIHHGLVFAPKAAKDNEINLQASDFRLLVAMLVHKGRALEPAPLYLLAWQHAAISSGYAECDLLTNYLKPAISRVRTKFKPMIPGFQIPGKREARGYAIKGPFRFCVILPAAEAAPYLKL